MVLGSDVPSCHPFGFGAMPVNPEIIPPAAPLPLDGAGSGRLKVKPHGSPAPGGPAAAGRDLTEMDWRGDGKKDKIKDTINKI